MPGLSSGCWWSAVYRLLLHAARGEGVGPARLPDFLGLEQGGELTLLGQDELDLSVLEDSLREQLERDAGGHSALSPLETERILLAAARVGQHVFAQQVLANCGSRCVFCGLAPAAFGAKRMLLAGHIKPWKDHDQPHDRTDAPCGPGLPRPRCARRVLRAAKAAERGGFSERIVWCGNLGS